MRRKTIIDGFRNGQRFRWIVREPNSGFQVGMYSSIKSLTEDFATTETRAAIWDTLLRLSSDRYQAQRQNKPLPTGLLHDVRGMHCQVDLVDQ